MIRVLYTVLTAVGFAAAVTFVVLYAWGDRDWFRSELGRNLMAKTAILGGLLGLSLLGLLIRVPGWVWIGGMATLDAVMWWRVVILWRIQHR